MYLKKSRQKSGRVYLAITEGHYDPTTKRTKTVNVQKIGYVDELEKEYPNPISHFQSVVDKMNSERQTGKNPVAITINGDEKVLPNSRKNFGYVALSAVYHELEIDRFLANRQQSIGAQYNMNAVMRLLVFSRLLSPGSKKAAYDEREWFFERCDFSLLDLYRALTRFGKFGDDLQIWMHKRIVSKYGRNTKKTYYDVTNYYFEIDEQDELRKKGVSKEHRPDPIVQMGLLMDDEGLPITYQVFEGNKNDCLTLLPVLKRVRREYGLGKSVVVADKGMNTQKNAYYLANSRGGYVFSQSVRGGSKELKAYVIKEAGYQWDGDSFKKSPASLPVSSSSWTTMGILSKVRYPKSKLLSTAAIMTKGLRQIGLP